MVPGRPTSSRWCWSRTMVRSTPASSPGCLLAPRGHWLTVEWLPKYAAGIERHQAVAAISRRIIWRIKPSLTLTRSTRESTRPSPLNAEHASTVGQAPDLLRNIDAFEGCRILQGCSRPRQCAAMVFERWLRKWLSLTLTWAAGEPLGLSFAGTPTTLWEARLSMRTMSPGLRGRGSGRDRREISRR